MTGFDLVVIAIGALFALLFGSWGGLAMRALYNKRKIPWKLHPESWLGYQLDRGGPRWSHWYGNGSDFLTWKLPR